MKNMGKKRTKKEYDPSDFVQYRGSEESGEIIEYEEVKHVTEKAVLLLVEGEEHWIPMSHIMDANDETVEVTKWIFGKLEI